MNRLPREVKSSTRWNILKKRRESMLLGVLLTLISLLPAGLWIFFSSFENDTPKIDYELINSQGKEITAEITDIETQYNVKINEVHPTIISYRYLENGQVADSKYKVLEEAKIADMEIGNNIKIKVLDGNSIIKDLEPYSFSANFLLIMALVLLTIGLSSLIYSVFHFRKELKLYKFGKVSQGKIVAMTPKYRLFSSNSRQRTSIFLPSLIIGLPFRIYSMFKTRKELKHRKFGEVLKEKTASMVSRSEIQGIVVHYEYETRKGKKILGKSLTTDLSMMNDEKKDELIPIFVSKENEEKSCIIPELEALKNGWNIDFG